MKYSLAATQNGAFHDAISMKSAVFYFEQGM